SGGAVGVVGRVFVRHEDMIADPDGVEGELLGGVRQAYERLSGINIAQIGQANAKLHTVSYCHLADPHPHPLARLCRRGAQPFPEGEGKRGTRHNEHCKTLTLQRCTVETLAARRRCLMRLEVRRVHRKAVQTLWVVAEDVAL